MCGDARADAPSRGKESAFPVEDGLWIDVDTLQGGKGAREVDDGILERQCAQVGVLDHATAGLANLRIGHGEACAAGEEVELTGREASAIEMERRGDRIATGVINDELGPGKRELEG